MEEKKHCKWYNDEFCTNDKSPCVADYCPVVEYPELCKCREVAEDINVPNKRELSDEDIKKSLECCTELGRCRECPYFIKKIDCIPDQRHGKDVLDFVNRLQSDNAKQKEEIEQLTERLGYFQKSSDYHEGNQKELEAKNAELQKQVDELKEERENMQAVIFGLEEDKRQFLKRLDEEFVSLKAVKAAEISPKAMKMLVESVGCVQKDTAKEIFQKLYNETIKDGIPAVYCFLTPKEIKDRAKRYGVEVE